MIFILLKKSMLKCILWFFIFVFLNIMFLEILAAVLIKDPEGNNLSKTCSREEKSPYFMEEQCFKSQEEIANMEYNTFIGYIPSANQSGIGWHTNANHFRYDEDLPKLKPKNEVRIFITGGSTAWGAGVRQDQTYAHLLEKKLNKQNAGKRYRVIIGAAGAWASSQERIFLFNYIQDFEPDILIMFSGWNDIYHAYTGKEYNKNQDFLYYRKAIYRARNLLKPEGRRMAEYTDIFEAISPPRYSEYTSKLWYLLDTIFYKYNSNRDKLLDKISQIQLESDNIINSTLENIELVHFLAKKRKFQLIYYLQPSIYHTNKELSLWEKQILQSSYTNYVGFAEYSSRNYNLLIDRIKTDAHKKGYNFINGDDSICQNKESVFADHVHFGDIGNTLISNHLYQILLEYIPKE